jgi:hypothetical protein
MRSQVGFRAAFAFEIADSSPERLRETGLLMKAPEKIPATRAKSRRRSFSLGRFRWQVSRKSGLFRAFHGQSSKVSLQVETAWRREVDSNFEYRFDLCAKIPCVSELYRVRSIGERYRETTWARPPDQEVPFVWRSKGEE